MLPRRVSVSTATCARRGRSRRLRLGTSTRSCGGLPILPRKRTGRSAQRRHQTGALQPSRDRASLGWSYPRPSRSTHRLCCSRSWREATSSSSCQVSASSARTSLAVSLARSSLDNCGAKWSSRVAAAAPQSACAGRGGGRPSRNTRGNHPAARATDHAPLVITCVDRESLAALRERHRVASFTRSSPTSSSSTNPSWTMPFPSVPSRPANRFSPAGISPAKPPFTRRPSSPIRFRPCISCVAWPRRIPTSAGRYRERSDAIAHRPIPCGATGSGGYYNPSLYRLIRATGFAHERRSRRRLVRRRQRPPDLRCRQRSRVQLSRPQSRHLR